MLWLIIPLGLDPTLRVVGPAHLGRAHQGHVALPPSFEIVKTVPFGCGDSMSFFVALGGWEVSDSWGVILFVTRSSRTCMAVHENG